MGGRERPYRAAGSGQEEPAGGLRSIDPLAKTLNREADGERREIGPGIKVDFSTGGWVERFDPEGPKNPKGERRSKHRLKTLYLELGNGFVA